MVDHDEVILPGKEGKIKVVIKGDRIHPGSIKKSFTVTSNDPENNKVLLFVKAKVRKVFDVSKSLVLTGFGGEDIELETEVTNLLDEPIRVTDYYWSGKDADIAIFEENIEVGIVDIEKGKKYLLTLKNKKLIEPGRYAGKLVLVTDFEELREKVMRVALTVNRIVDVNPGKIYYGEMKISEGETREFKKRFQIVAIRGDSLKVMQVIPSRDDIKVDIQEMLAGKVFQGTVVIRPVTPTRNYSASIKILTNYPGYGELEVTVTGSVVSTGSND